jgi:bifunctional DNA-binding transcriptional regulator/antitoxin component of YhaV-PrlF toxin-antitoxin module
MKMPVYKIMDDRGRVLIPQEWRTLAGLERGDIVRLDFSGGAIAIKKVALIEVGDQSPEAVEAYVRAAIREMPQGTQIAIAAELLGMMEGRKGSVE